MFENTKSARCSVRRPAVAGQFYPADPEELQSEVTRYLEAAKDVCNEAPKAVIAPHAGYLYSGPIAGTVYSCLARGCSSIRRVVLAGPAHLVGFEGVALSSAQFFSTPLGKVPVDEASLKGILSLPQVTIIDEAHQREHSLEVQLPFLQSILSAFSLVPLLVGDASTSEVGAVFEALWGGMETCVVVSSDLSHYHDYRSAQALDEAAASVIESLNPDGLNDDQACGNRPIRGLLQVARQHRLACRTVDLRNSGDTAGRRDRVVGYGGFVFL